MAIMTNRRQLRTKSTVILFQILSLFLATALFYGCGSKSGDNGPQPPAAAGDLVSFGEIITLQAAQLNQQFALLGLTGVTASGTVTCYKLSYGTPDVSNALVTASGLVCLPSAKSGGNPVISYQHGTIFQDSEAPSSFITSSEAVVGVVLAGIGYIAVLPDYIGYGDSTNELHPYVHAATLASATVNMNRAARKFLDDPGIKRTTNGQFFLTGYSEGGYATLATQRLMQQSLSAEFPVTASEPGAGPYDMTGTTLAILSSPTLSQPAFAGFFFKAYDSIYNTPSQLTRYFSTIFANIVDTHFDGSFSRSQVSNDLGGPGVFTNALFNQAFLSSYLSSTGESTLKAHIAENDIYNWAPSVPTQLFHSRDDDTVPFANTTTAQTTMAANGSTKVTLATCNSGTLPATHINCARPFALDMIAFFKTLLKP
jgi:pimeloyl-ACP methyl ester carboxylesterase